MKVYDDYISWYNIISETQGNHFKPDSITLFAPINSSDRTLPAFLKLHHINPEFSHIFWDVGLSSNPELVAVLVYEEKQNPVFEEPIL